MLSPRSRAVRRSCARVFAATQMSANVSEATTALTSRSIRPLIAPASGPTSFCRRGLSEMTPAKTSLRVASTSTCCSIAFVTVVAMACWTSGSSMSGPTVAT